MFFLRILFFLALVLAQGVAAEKLSPESVRRQASNLLFFLGSKDVSLTEAQKENMLSRGSEAAGALYKRVFENRQNQMDSDSYANRKRVEGKKVYHLKAKEIRSACLELLLELGDGALEVLLDSIHSSRQEVVLGIMKGLHQFEDPRVVLLISDVLELDKWGRSKFSSLVRRQAVMNLGKYVELEMSQILLGRAIEDNDRSVRENAQVVLSEVKKGKLEKFIEETYVKGFEFEMGRYQEDLVSAKARGVLEQFQKDEFKLSSLCILLESLAKTAPDVFAKIHIPEELIGSRVLLRMFLQYQDVLPKDMRKKALDFAFSHSKDGAVAIDTLRALKADDQERYGLKLKPYLSLKSDPAVIHQALVILGDWDVSPYVEEIRMIAQGARQKEIKDLATAYMERF